MLSRRLLRIKTVKSLYSYFQSGGESLIRSEKELTESIRKSYELYLMMIALIGEVAEVARERIAIGQAKLMPTAEDLNPNRRFVDNRVIALIEQSAALDDAMVRYKAGWSGQEALIKRLYQDMIAAPYYQRYMESPVPETEKEAFAADRRLVVDFLTTHIEDNEYLEEALEEMSMFWVDDISYSLGLAIRTIGLLNETSTDLDVMPMYKSDDDKEYVETLFRKALVCHEEYFGYIDKFTENWDFDRIAFMDKLIMLAAITELVQFPTIPVKVTLDEFIEISKYYSTPGSSVFVNGILDKLVVWLTEQGKIAKTGRGLIDSSVPKEKTTTHA
ncbi:transcription antitermination protein NusB [Millionella massiliensis]|uniref:transcription antitermination protein NusB n=1 Tax=Millionella massiliensis TaxID=1871023 RepID=UPI0008DABDF9|nr:transcription antitermination protein NusB [Millionella massiliensis]